MIFFNYFFYIYMLPGVILGKYNFKAVLVIIAPGSKFTLIKKRHYYMSILWGGWRDSNSRHPASQAGALTNWATAAIITGNYLSFSSSIARKSALTLYLSCCFIIQLLLSFLSELLSSRFTPFYLKYYIVAVFYVSVQKYLLLT